MKTCNSLTTQLEISVRETLAEIIDPEIGINIVDIGLVYGIEADDKHIHIQLTLTSPACPMGEMVLEDVHAGLKHAFPDAEIEVELVWEPPWTPDMMTPAAKAQLGWDDA